MIHGSSSPGIDLNIEQCVFNLVTCHVRITVRKILKEVKMFFLLIKYKKKLRIMHTLAEYLHLAVIRLYNFCNWIYSDLVAQYFECQTSPLDLYLYRKDNYSNHLSEEESLRWHGKPN